MTPTNPGPRLRDYCIQERDEDLTRIGETTVDLIMSDGTIRHVQFYTAHAIYALRGEHEGTYPVPELLHAGRQDLLIVTRIDEDVIARTLRYLDERGELIACSTTS
jgi:hypothetical protein